MERSSNQGRIYGVTTQSYTPFGCAPHAQRAFWAHWHVNTVPFGSFAYAVSSELTRWLAWHHIALEPKGWMELLFAFHFPFSTTSPLTRQLNTAAATSWWAQSSWYMWTSGWSSVEMWVSSGCSLESRIMVRGAWSFPTQWALFIAYAPHCWRWCWHSLLTVILDLPMVLPQ